MMSLGPGAIWDCDTVAQDLYAESIRVLVRNSFWTSQRRYLTRRMWRLEE